MFPQTINLIRLVCIDAVHAFKVLHFSSCLKRLNEPLANVEETVQMKKVPSVIKEPEYCLQVTLSGQLGPRPAVGRGGTFYPEDWGFI